MHPQNSAGSASAVGETGVGVVHVRGLRHALACLAATGVAAVLLSGISPLEASADQAPAPSEAEQALQQAQESGHQVEVVGRRTENTTTYANPDGFTFTL